MLERWNDSNATARTRTSVRYGIRWPGGQADLGQQFDVLSQAGPFVELSHLGSCSADAISASSPNRSSLSQGEGFELAFAPTPEAPHCKYEADRLSGSGCVH